jgi:hypothetical protein
MSAATSCLLITPGRGAVVDRLTGKTRSAQLFVTVLGTSNFTYC